MMIMARSTEPRKEIEYGEIVQPDSDDWTPPWWGGDERAIVEAQAFRGSVNRIGRSD